MLRAVVTGGAGFLGSHLCDRLLREGWGVSCLDSLLTGSTDNLSDALSHDRFSFVQRDVTEPFDVEGEVDHVLHLASPASPVDYLRHPIETLRVGALGTISSLDLARKKDAIFLLASTSEVYGDPKVHPQTEDYWGNVNPIGPRGVYDEAKRFAEAATLAYHRVHGVPVRIVRIFNTYGPRMKRGDGRAVPTFVSQALEGKPLTVHGDGTQTRSLCYVDDLIEGILRLATSELTGPVNIGNPREVTIRELAELILTMCGSSSTLTFTDRPVDDPEVRCPDIGLAQRELGWSPSVPLEQGLARSIDWAGRHWGAHGAEARTGRSRSAHER